MIEELPEKRARLLRVGTGALVRQTDCAADRQRAADRQLPPITQILPARWAEAFPKGVELGGG